MNKLIDVINSGADDDMTWVPPPAGQIICGFSCGGECIASAGIATVVGLVTTMVAM